jgi:hypothetical protein
VVLFLFSHPTEWQGFKAAASPFFFFLCGTTVDWEKYEKVEVPW